MRITCEERRVCDLEGGDVTKVTGGSGNGKTARQNPHLPTAGKCGPPARSPIYRPMICTLRPSSGDRSLTFVPVRSIEVKFLRPLSGDRSLTFVFMRSS